MSNSQLPTNLTRSNSVSSFTSDQLEEDEDSCDTVQFDTARLTLQDIMKAPVQ